MPAIYSRFMDKEAREWRQIYKALQLLEYIIKHGSERVVDDARSHLSTLKMLRNFHYIDEKGKDQGINVRNRAKEIAELLGDLDKVRAERRKAKMNRNKYTGTGSDSMGFGSSGSRYGGFSSDDYYGSYSGGGGGGGSSSYSGNYGSSGGSGGFSDSTSKQQFEEYDAGEWEDRPARTSTSSTHARSSSNPPRGGTTAAKPSTAAIASPAKPAVPAKDKAKEVDLLGFGFDDAPNVAPVAAAPTVTTTASTTASKTAASNDFDDFDDFQSAPVAAAPVTNTTPKPAGQPLQATGGTNVFDLLNATQPTPSAQPSIPAAMSRPSYGGSSMGMTSGGGMGMGAPLMPNTTMAPTNLMQASAASQGGRATPTQAGRSTPGAGNAAKASTTFDDLWSTSLTSNTGRSAPTATGGSTAGKSIMDLQKEKAQAAFWGAPGTQTKPSGGMNNFGGASTTPAGGSSGGGGLDDLLL
ncbi:hypothetical protein CPB86DRAFT_787236 [Serendipita vermifera]|nr:hypothetical protein CPB86DRAFT_787236 [Serendipita vermifera]